MGFTAPEGSSSPFRLQVTLGALPPLPLPPLYTSFGLMAWQAVSGKCWSMFNSCCPAFFTHSESQIQGSCCRYFRPAVNTLLFIGWDFLASFISPAWQWKVIISGFDLHIGRESKLPHPSREWKENPWWFVERGDEGMQRGKKDPYKIPIAASKDSFIWPTQG